MIEEIEDFSLESDGKRNQESEYLGFRKLDEFSSTIKKLFALKFDTTSEEEFENLDGIITGLLK